MKVFLSAILIAMIFTQDQICEHLRMSSIINSDSWCSHLESNHLIFKSLDYILNANNLNLFISRSLGFGQANFHHAPKEKKVGQKLTQTINPHEQDYYVDETTYRRDQRSLDWVAAENDFTNIAVPVSTSVDYTSTASPTKVQWKILMDIEYKLRYFKELGTDMYAPVFSKEVKKLDKKEVIIEGYVIPIDQEAKLMALSYYPYSSCFFCGKASPASVVSIYLKDSDKFYGMDERISLKGKLRLNYDDPNEFYYILHDAEEN